MGDRTKLVPAHRGSTTLPSSPIFSRLVRFAHNRPPRIAVRDVNAGIEADYLQLLTDVLAFRNRLESILGQGVRSRLDAGDEVYVAVLAGGGYEYTVAMLAVVALGAAPVPLTIALPAGEAFYYASKSRAIALLTSSSAMQKGRDLERLVKNADSTSKFSNIAIAPSVFSPLLVPSEIKLSSDRYLDDNAAGCVIFTSGTSGKPKGAVMRRAYIFDCALGVADHYSLNESDVLLHLLPVHHATGVGIMFFPFLIAGACTEYRSGGFDPEWTWERWRQGGITFFSGVPTIYMRMMRYYQQKLSKRSDVAEYVRGARSLRTCICGTSALPKPIADFWTEILDKKILLRYGGTEFGAVFKVREGDDEVPDGSVGEAFPGVDVKLSEGDEGEVLVKTPYMFSKYLFDEDATAAAHDSEGYYKTGDIARREGKYYWIMGRASVDIIKSGGYKISALDIEREVLALPYVSEVTVVGVPDDEFGQRVAAAIVLRDDTGADSDQQTCPAEQQKVLKIDQLRKDLGDRLARYKMPTLLRVVTDELPKSATGKISKKVLGPILFPLDYASTGEVQIWESVGRNNVAKPRL